MRDRLAGPGDHAGMKRDPVHREPLHEGHRRILVQAAMVGDLLFENAVAARGRVVAGLAGGDGGDADQGGAAEDVGALQGDADDDADRAGGGRGFGLPARLAGAEAVIGEQLAGLHRDGDLGAGGERGRHGEEAERERTPQQ